MGSRLSTSVAPSPPSAQLGQSSESSSLAPAFFTPTGSSTSRDGPTSSSRLASIRTFQGNARRQFDELTEKIPAATTTVGGQYSISKLAAFEAYQQSTSFTQSAAVLLLIPTPCIVVVLLLESIPLASPALGYQANGVYYVRMLLGTFVVASAVACTIEEFIPEIQLPWTKLSVIGCAQALVFVGTILGIAAASGVFPVPFSLLIPVGPMMLVGTYIHYLLARSKIALTADFLPRYRHVIEVIQMESVPLMLYPVYATLFMQLSPWSQLWFSFVLPVLKFLCRFLVWNKIQRHDMDIVGAISAASSQLFHVLFTMTCVQNAKTRWTLGLLLTWNALQALVCCESMAKAAKKINEHQQQQTATTTSHSANDAVPVTASLSARVLTLLEQKPVITRLFQLDQRVLLSSYYRYHDRKWTTVHQQLLQIHVSTTSSPGQAARLSPSSTSSNPSLAEPGADVVDRPQGNYSLGDRFGRKVRAMSAIIHSVATGSVSVVPHEPNLTSASATLRQQSQEPSAQRAASIAVHVAQIQGVIAALHSTEVILLRCYISIVAYFLYGAYVLSVFHLSPNSAFILSLMRVGSTQEMNRIMTKLGLLCAGEALVLGTYLATVQQIYGIAGIKQLAFALSSQKRIVQAKLVVWSVIIFSFPLLHCGNDVTFKFEWLRNAKSNH